MKLAIAGYRGFTDYHLFKHHLVSFIEEHGKPAEIISGGAKGADSMAERYAKEENIPIVVLKPDWKTRGRQAGLLRNTDIVARCSHLLAFPPRRFVPGSPGTNTSVGRGTQDTIKKAKRSGKIIKQVWV
jgi:hypothetical protein